jgi:hypothetical protein
LRIRMPEIYIKHKKQRYGKT